MEDTSLLPRKLTVPIARKIRRNSISVRPGIPIIAPVQSKDARNLLDGGNRVNLLSSSGKFDSSYSNLLVNPDPLGELPAHIFRLKIMSNYGHQSLIGFSEIDFLSQNNEVIFPKSVYVEPRRHSPPTLTRLFNGRLMKNDEDSVWTDSWPPPAPFISIEMFFSLYTKKRIELIRIWPSKWEPSINPKIISLYMDNTVVYQGELRLDFGVVIPVASEENPERALKERAISRRFSLYSDKHGLIPTRATNVLEIHPICNFSGGNTFTLRGIRIFNFDGKAMDLQYNTLIELVNIQNSSPIDELFSLDDKLLYWSENNGKENWSATVKDGQDGYFSITFAEPILVAAIVVFNSLPVMNTPDLSLKNLRITSNKNTLWIGKVRRETSLSAPRGPATLIALCQNAELIAKIHTEADPTGSSRAENKNGNTPPIKEEDQANPQSVESGNSSSRDDA